MCRFLGSKDLLQGLPEGNCEQLSVAEVLRNEGIFFGVSLADVAFIIFTGLRLLQMFRQSGVETKVTIELYGVEILVQLIRQVVEEEYFAHYNRIYVIELHCRSHLI